MTILIVICLLSFLGFLWFVTTKVIELYKSMKTIEQNLIQEVSHTKKAFNHLMGDIFEDKKEKPREPRIIEAEVIDEVENDHRT